MISGVPDLQGYGDGKNMRYRRTKIYFNAFNALKSSCKCISGSVLYYALL